MPDSRRRHCMTCGEHSSTVGAISWAGHCRDCGKRIMNQNADEISAGHGGYHKRRLWGLQRYAARALLDDQRNPA